MRIVAKKNNLDCSRIRTPDLINPSIKDNTKGTDLLQLQEKKMAVWLDYVYQKFVDQVGVNMITANINAQYINPCTKNTWDTKNARSPRCSLNRSHGFSSPTRRISI